jgi:hypothetical protein
VLDNRGTGDSDRPLGLWSMDDLAPTSSPCSTMPASSART